jgi:hypothetical protein
MSKKNDLFENYELSKNLEYYALVVSNGPTYYGRNPF